MPSKRIAIVAALSAAAIGAAPAVEGASGANRLSVSLRSADYGASTTGWLCFNMVDGTVTHVAADVSACSVDEVPLPIGMASFGPRMLRLAGAIADRVALNMISPAAVPALVADVHEGARAVGRAAARAGARGGPAAVPRRRGFGRRRGARGRGDSGLLPGRIVVGRRVPAERILARHGEGRHEQDHVVRNATRRPKQGEVKHTHTAGRTRDVSMHCSTWTNASWRAGSSGAAHSGHVRYLTLTLPAPHASSTRNSSMNESEN